MTNPEAIKRIIECEENRNKSLDLSNLELTSIPEEIANLFWLEELNLSFNQVGKISTLNKLVNLKTLDLCGNNLSNIEGFETLNKIEDLDLSGNKIDKIDSLEMLTKLKILCISNNRISKIEGLSKLTALLELDLSTNEIYKIEGLETLKRLKYLNLNNNNLLSLENLDNNNQLISLLLMSNNLSKIEGVENLRELTYLSLSHNNIIKIEGLNYLSSLSDLDLSDNSINSLSGCNTLNNLSRLNISYNKINDINGINNAPELASLDLSFNRISTLSSLSLLTSLKKLQYLKINNNPLEEKLALLFDSKQNHLSQLINIIQREQEDRISISLPAKILLLGNHATGKSSLLHYILHENSNYSGGSTHILKIEKYPLNSQNPKAIFYDFGGQDFYHGMHKPFFSRNSGYLLLWSNDSNFNTSCKDDENNLNTNFNIEYWIGQKKHFEYHSNYSKDPVFLVQTHTHGKRQINYTDFVSQEIEECFFINLSDDFDTLFSNVKALEYLKSRIEDLIESLTVSREEPPWYARFYNYILNSTAKQAIHIETLLEYYSPHYGNGTFEEILDSLKAELEQLHNQGLVLYNQNADENHVWLNPLFVINLFHKEFLKSNNKGVISKKRWKEIAPDLSLTKLLIYERIIFEHHHKYETEYIIPNFLPLAEEESYEFDLFTFGLNKIEFILKFKHFVPSGIINHLISVFGKQKDKKRFWRNQILFTFEAKCKVLIKLDLPYLEIKVYISFLEQVSYQEQDIIKKYIYYVLMSSYWDSEPIDFDEFNPLTNKHYKIKNKLRSLKKRVNPKFKNLETILQNDDYCPPDLYVSLDNKAFVNLSELRKYPTSETKIMTYKLDNNATFIAYQEMPIKQFEIFTNKNFTAMKKVFISYSKDDLKLVNRFRDALIPLQDDGIIGDSWYCTFLEAGSKWDDEIQQKLKESDIVFFMCSMSFLRTKYIREHEISTAKELNKIIIPIILNFCEWERYLGDYTALPYTAKPVCDFQNEDLAWYLVSSGIRVSLELANDNQQELSKRVRELFERMIAGELSKK